MTVFWTVWLCFLLIGCDRVLVQQDVRRSKPERHVHQKLRGRSDVIHETKQEESVKSVSRLAMDKDSVTGIPTVNTQSADNVESSSDLASPHLSPVASSSSSSSLPDQSPAAEATAGAGVEEVTEPSDQPAESVVDDDNDQRSTEVRDDDISAGSHASAADTEMSETESEREEKVANVEHEHDRSAEAPVSSVDTDNVKTKVSTATIDSDSKSTDEAADSGDKSGDTSADSDDMSPDSGDKSAVAGTVSVTQAVNESIDVKLPSEDMPSFDEWKQKEQEKTKNSTDTSIQASASSSSTKVKSNKKGVNYASVTCGAKIVSVNPEAQNTVFVLMENKDQYMINPCKAKKFFVVELCESVQVQTIELGNLELFSSLPQSFEVHVSERHLTKDWKSLGTFHARDERSVQTFPVQDVAMFSKYLRVDMQAHYGTEHFCPLTVLRVFGVTLDEDDDDREGDHSSGDDDESLTENTDNPTNLFSSATDTVLSIVKNVLKPNVEEISDGDLVAASENATNSTDAVADNAASAAESGTTATDITESCEHDTGSDSEAIMSNTAREQLESSTESGTEESLVRLVESPPTEAEPTSAANNVTRLPLRRRLMSCQMCDSIRGQHDTEPVICGYLLAVSRTSSPPLQQQQTERVDFGMSHDSRDNINGSDPLPPVDLTNETDSQPSSEMASGSSSSSNAPAAEAGVKPMGEVMSDTEPMSGESQTQSATDSAASSELPSSVPATSMVSDDKAPTLNDSSSKNMTGNAAESPIGPSASEDEQNSSSSSSAAASGPGTRRDIYAESSSQHDQHHDQHTLPDVDPDTHTAVDEIAYQKLRGSKETMYTKLKNRIRTLEDNLNLTNRYLEELSRRYKRQMEEMYSSLNHTITKLSNTAKIAAEQDKRQLERIAVLEAQVSNLTSTVAALSHDIELANTKLIERHLVLMACELIVFILLLTYTSSRQSVTTPSTRSSNTQTSVQELEPLSLSESHTPVPNSIDMSTSPQRRRSVDHPRTPWSDITQHAGKSGSENDLTSVEHDLLLNTDNADTTDTAASVTADFQKRQRKKKKSNQVKCLLQSQLQKSLSCPVNGQSALPSTTVGKKPSLHPDYVEDIGPVGIAPGRKSLPAGILHSDTGKHMNVDRTSFNNAREVSFVNGTTSKLDHTNHRAKILDVRTDLTTKKGRSSVG